MYGMFPFGALPYAAVAFGVVQLPVSTTLPALYEALQGVAAPVLADPAAPGYAGRPFGALPFAAELLPGDPAGPRLYEALAGAATIPTIVYEATGLLPVSAQLPLLYEAAPPQGLALQLGWSEIDFPFVGPVTGTTPPVQQGQVTLANDDLVAWVTLSPAQPNASYMVLVSPIRTTGAPIGLSATVLVVAKAPTAFAIVLASPPGVGNGVTLQWRVLPSGPSGTAVQRQFALLYESQLSTAPVAVQAQFPVLYESIVQPFVSQQFPILYEAPQLVTAPVSNTLPVTYEARRRLARQSVITWEALGTAPSGLTPNLPAGFVSPVGYTRDFNADPEGLWTFSGAHSTIRDASTYTPAGVTAPRNPPASPNNIGEALFPTTLVQGTAPIWDILPTATVGANNWKKLYVAIWVQLSSNWVSHPSGVNKVIFINLVTGGTPGKYVLSAQGGIGGGSFWQHRLQALEADPQASGGTRNLANLVTWPVTGGLWQRIEVVLTANTPGLANGQIQSWASNYNSAGLLVSGPTQITNIADIGWVSASQPGTVGGPMWEPVWGGNTTGATIPATQYMWMDKIYVAGHT